MMNLKPFLPMLVMVAAVAGCSSNKPIPNPAIAACPEKTVSIVQANQNFLKDVVPGETSDKHLKDLKGLRRRATLVKGDDAADVYFYQTGVPRCPWVMAEDMITPVVVRDDKITAVGEEDVKTMIAHGWVLKEAKWPWQRYDFGYLPQN